MGKAIHISKFSLNRNAEIGTSNSNVVDTLELLLSDSLLNIDNMFMNCLTKIAISIPE